MEKKNLIDAYLKVLSIYFIIKFLKKLYDVQQTFTVTI